jgi:hypothetical protein
VQAALHQTPRLSAAAQGYSLSSCVFVIRGLNELGLSDIPPHSFGESADLSAWTDENRLDERPSSGVESPGQSDLGRWCRDGHPERTERAASLE